MSETTNDPPSITNPNREIHKISKDVSSRICTAQVVVSLRGAVRQLIDNSIDAGAKVLDIRLKNNGFDSFEVIDDGSGIEPDDFNSLCQPHSTSKLKEFSDFRDLITLGFRGEALNALCALSLVTITTRSRSSLLGTKLRFDRNGSITEQSNIARPIGTTVLIENLFHTLPVRRKEFEKTSKRELGRVLSCVQCFALSRPEVRFSCSNVICGTSKQLICTTGSGSVKDVVTNLFGGRSDKNKMVEVVPTFPDENVCAIYGLNPSKIDEYQKIQLRGFVSSCERGFGRSAADRQFLYVNHRPVDHPKVCRAVNEVYQQYNRAQYPTLVLFIEVPPESIDVNVTPDKRTVLFSKEKEMVALIRASILATFQPLLGSFTSVQDRQSTSTMKATPSIAENSPSLLSSSVPSVFDLLRSMSHSKKRMAGNNNEDPTPFPKKNRLEPSSVAKTLESFAFKVTPHRKSVEEPVGGREDSSHSAAIEQTADPDPVCHDDEPRTGDASAVSPSPEDTFSTERVAVVDAPSPLFARPQAPVQRSFFTPPALKNLSRGFENSIQDEDEWSRLEGRMNNKEQRSEASDELRAGGSVSIKKEKPLSQTTVCSQLDEHGNFLRPQQKIRFSVSKLFKRMEDIRGKKNRKNESSGLSSGDFQSAIRMEENGAAEEELRRVLSKSDFSLMSVIGQFNNGFIVTRLKSHLFIIDQHASDEKYNFERFQKKAHVETQRLIRPLVLDFGAVQEGVIRDNLHIFRANGFEFEFKENDEGGSRAFVTCIPVLHNWQFDKNDIDEILSVVSEFPGEMYRPSKLRRIFASRACRKSVMIGTTLTVKRMEEIVAHLGTLDQPWNCPHGRPTLRHLLSLSV